MGPPRCAESYLRSDPRYIVHVTVTWILIQIQWLWLRLSGSLSRNTAAGRPVQMSRVWRGHRILFTVSHLDFYGVHETFVSCDYLQKDEVSLYDVDSSFAYFVEVPTSVDIHDSDTDPFMYNAQLQHAVRLLTVPLGVFCRWIERRKKAEEETSQEAPVVVIWNTGRCGSTLLTQMFEGTGAVKTISEPVALAKMLERPGLWRDDVIRAIMTSLLGQDGREWGSRLPRVLKTKSECLYLLPLVARVFPRIKHIFMYRDGMATMDSWMRALVKNKSLGKVPHFALYKRLFEPVHHMPYRPVHQEFSRVSCFTSFFTWQWACLIRKYRDFREQGIAIHSVKYEELIREPEELFRDILRVVDFPGDLASSALRALERDSQRGLVISTRSREKNAGCDVIPVVLPEYQEVECKTRCDVICDSFDVPRLCDVTMLR